MAIDPKELPAQILAKAVVPGLHLVATPIGSARDITLRALDVLNAADILAAEDTRNLRHLLSIHGVPLRDRRIVAYHEHNGDRARPTILAALAEGKSVAYASDAGTPLVADPGYKLAQMAISEGIRVHALPGPSAMLAALTVSGLPSDRFLFAGFIPNAKGARKTFLKEWAAQDATVIFYESPRRVKDTLKELCEIDEDRAIVVARELTKKFEEVRRGSVGDLVESEGIAELKGEVVILLDRAGAREASDDDLKSALEANLTTMRLKDAAKQVADEFGVPRRHVYQLGLELEK